MVISSKLEGGANVVSEAIACEVPVIASRIDGNVGLLGKNYPGYYPCGDTRALAGLLLRAEKDEKFYSNLKSHIARIDVSPASEMKAWKELLSGLV